jgi:two-component sensor histidine kinase
LYHSGTKQIPTASLRQTEWVLHEAMNRVALMAKVYERLYTGGDMREIDLQPFLEEVAETAALSYDVFDTVTVFTRFDDITISSNEAVNIGIIVNELLTNCFKYAFPGKMRGTVDVSVKQEGKERLEIVVHPGCRPSLTGTVCR